MPGTRTGRGLALPAAFALALIAMATATIGSLYPVTSTFATPGDGTAIRGGPTAAGSGTVSLTAGGAGQPYVVSAVVPAGSESGVPHNLGAVDIIIDYDQTKVTASCPQSTNPGGFGEILCNPNQNGTVHIAFANLIDDVPPGIGYTATTPANPITLATVTFTALAGAPNTANAILSTSLVDCLNGAGQDINCTPSFGALQIGTTGGGWVVGDMNCDNNITTADANILLGIFLGRPAAQPGACVQRLDINCSATANEPTTADANLVLGFFLGRPAAVIPQTCPPPDESSTSISPLMPGFAEPPRHANAA